MSCDNWAVTPAVDDALYRASASFAGAGAAVLLTNVPGPNGVGYKVVVTSTGDESAKTFTIVGRRTGSSKTTSEVVTGPNATTALSTYFYSYVESITINAASVGNVKLGTSGSMALPRCRLKGLTYVGATNAGTIKINTGSTTGTLMLQIDTPAGATAVAHEVSTGSILLGGSAADEFSIVTLAEVSKVTLFCE